VDIGSEHQGLRNYIRTVGKFVYRESSHHTADHSAGIVISPHSPNIEVPPASSVILERIMHLTQEGATFYLTRNGEQITGLGPARLLQAALMWPGDLDDADDAPIRPITDPARLLGPGVPDFDRWFNNVMSDRRQP
jgi:hypothetical protein